MIRATKYIYANIHNKITSKEIADHIGITPLEYRLFLLPFSVDAEITWLSECQNPIAYNR